MGASHRTSLVVLACIAAVAGCSHGGGNSSPSTSDEWDIDKDGVPQFVETSYIDLDKIYRVSRFRSGVGHDYSDAFEHCRSMKHYFEPKADVDWSAVAVFAPVAGTITRLDQEWAGTKLELQSERYPAFRFLIFHVTLSSPLQVGGPLTAGQALGHHVGSETMSDIGVIVNDPTHQGRMVSYFETITDAVFQAYVDRGMHSRADAIISRAERDADPLSCTGDVFAGEGNIPNWVVLQ